MGLEEKKGIGDRLQVTGYRGGRLNRPEKEERKTPPALLKGSVATNRPHRANGAN